MGIGTSRVEAPGSQSDDFRQDTYGYLRRGFRSDIKTDGRVETKQFFLLDTIIQEFVNYLLDFVPASDHPDIFMAFQ